MRKISPKMVNPRVAAGNAEEYKEEYQGLKQLALLWLSVSRRLAFGDLYWGWLARCRFTVSG